jgi:hypothetical protein
MRSTIILGLSSAVSAAAIEKRDAVPAGYVAAPYYPCMLIPPRSSGDVPVVLTFVDSSTWRMGVRLERKLSEGISARVQYDTSREDESHSGEWNLHGKVHYQLSSSLLTKYWDSNGGTIDVLVIPVRQTESVSRSFACRMARWVCETRITTRHFLLVSQSVAHGRKI